MASRQLFSIHEVIRPQCVTDKKNYLRERAIMSPLERSNYGGLRGIMAIPRDNGANLRKINDKCAKKIYEMLQHCRIYFMCKIKRLINRTKIQNKILSTILCTV